MANVATTKYQSANGGDWVEIKLEWSYTNTATTATISAALYVRRDGYGPTEGADQYWISLNGTKFVDSSGYHIIGTSFVQVCSGSKTINLTNGGASATSLTLDGYYNNNLSSTKLHALRVNKANYSGGYWTTSYGTQGSPLTGTVPAQASACTAPTSVTLAVNGSTNTIIVPNGTIKISWSGAAGGTNNPIDGYIVYYRVGANPTTSTYTGRKVDVPANSSSTTFVLSNAERGKAIYVGVITKAANSAYNSGLKTGGGNITVNILPGAPSIKTDAYANYSGTSKTQYIISTKSNVYATATVGSDTYSVSTPVVKHNTSNSHSGETNFTAGNLSCGSSGSLTHYFWTFDGLEYSTVTKLTVTKLAKPTIQSEPAPVITRSTYTAKNSTYTYQVSFGNIVSNFASGKYYIQYWMRAGNSGGEWKDYTSGDFSATTFNPNKTFAFESYLPATITSNYSFWFRVRTSKTDTVGSIDYSDWWNYGASTLGSSGTEYIYAGPWDNPTGITKGPPSFSFTIKNDTRLTTWTITAKKGSTAFTVTASTSVSENNRNFSISSADSSGDTIIYTITGTNGTITKSTSFSRTMRKKTTVTSITFSSTTMNVYGGTPSGTITVKGVRGDDFNSNPSGAIAAVRGTTTQSTGKSVSVIQGANTSYEVTVSVSLADFFDGNTKTLGIAKSSRYGLSTYQFKVTFTNNYNESISLTSGNCTLNFDTAPTVTFSIKYKNSASATTYSDLGSHYIQQGQILSFNYSITNYTYRALTVSMQRGTSLTNTTEIASTSITAANAGADTRTAKTITGALTYTMPEVNDSSIYWKIIVTQSGTNTQANNNIATSNIIRFTAPTNFQITDIIPTDNGYTVSYTLGSLGVTPSNTDPKRTATAVLKYDNGTTFGSAVSVGTSSSGTLSFNGTKLTSTKTFYLVLTTNASTTSGYINNSHSLNSNTKTVYVEEPTVAYRTNQLGINLSTPSSTAFLDIATTSNKEELFIRKGGTVMLKITFNNTDTTILDIP